MSKRRAAVLAVLAILAAGVGTHLSVQAKRPHCDRKRYDAVRLGMTLEEVSAAIGLPPGDYTGRQFRPSGGYWEREASEAGAAGVRALTWCGTRGMIVVAVDGKGRAVAKEFMPGTGPECPFLAFCRERLPSWGR
jgi:hypothetical protein